MRLGKFVVCRVLRDIWPGCLTITSQDDPSTGPAGGDMGRYVIGNIVNILTIEVTIMLFV